MKSFTQTPELLYCQEMCQLNDQSKKYKSYLQYNLLRNPLFETPFIFFNFVKAAR